MLLTAEHDTRGLRTYSQPGVLREDTEAHVNDPDGDEDWLQMVD